jgi:hypothetical protein
MYFKLPRLKGFVDELYLFNWNFWWFNAKRPQMIFYLDRYEPQTVSTQQPGTQKLKKIIMGLQGLYLGQRRPTSNHTFTSSPSFLMCMLHIN